MRASRHRGGRPESRRRARPGVGHEALERSLTEPRSIVVIVAAPCASLVTLAPGRPARATRFLSAANLAAAASDAALSGKRDDHAAADGRAVDGDGDRGVAEPGGERVQAADLVERRRGPTTIRPCRPGSPGRLDRVLDGLADVVLSKVGDGGRRQMRRDRAGPVRGTVAPAGYGATSSRTSAFESKRTLAADPRRDLVEQRPSGMRSSRSASTAVSASMSFFIWT